MNTRFLLMFKKLTGAFYAGLLDGLLGVAGTITSDEMDHSRKFPT